MLSGPSLAFLKSAKVAWLVEENDSLAVSSSLECITFNCTSHLCTHSDFIERRK